MRDRPRCAKVMGNLTPDDGGMIEAARINTIDIIDTRTEAQEGSQS